MFFGLCAGLLVADHLQNLNSVFELSNEPRALLSGAALIWIIGVLDDKFEIDALIKLGGQMIAAGVMVMQGLTILWIPVPGVGTVSLTQWQGTLLTVALVVITINAVNFVDGLDGLAAGMVCIAAAAFFLYAYRIWFGYGIEAAAPATLFTAILMGMCLGFLPHNMHPARIFMGDSGSMLIGLVLAAAAISVTGQVDPDALKIFEGSDPPGHARGAAGLHPAAAAADDHRDPGRRPGARDRAPYLERTVAVRRRPRPSAPPAAGDRALAQPRGPDHVLLVGADRLRRRRVLRALGVDVDRAAHRRAERGGPGASAAAALHPARPALGGGLRAAALPAPQGAARAGGCPRSRTSAGAPARRRRPRSARRSRRCPGVNGATAIGPRSRFPDRRKAGTRG